MQESFFRMTNSGGRIRIEADLSSRGLAKALSDIVRASVGAAGGSMVDAFDAGAGLGGEDDGREVG